MLIHQVTIVFYPYVSQLSKLNLHTYPLRILINFEAPASLLKNPSFDPYGKSRDDWVHETSSKRLFLFIYINSNSKIALEIVDITHTSIQRKSER